MCHDGANAVPISTDTSLLGASEEVYARIEALESARKIRFRAMIGWFINEGYNVALINGLDWMDTKVRSMSAPAFHSLTLGTNIGHEHGCRRWRTK